MNYDLDGICQDCIYLEKIKPLFEEKDKEIERLNNIINGKFATICIEKMIDKLSATEMIVLQEKEINRLNNIIAELEKWLKENLTKDDIKNHFVVVSVIGVLEKLKELKGSDKDDIK